MIKFYLLALWVSYNKPDNIHNGELQGTAELHKSVAVYQENDCRIRMEFSPKQAKVTELEVEGCGFGANVTAAGVYRKLDNKKPKFDF
jgi:hypothetical protein